MAGERWRNLRIWQLADDLALRVYELTRDFPNEELYGLTSQLRRAALSIPTNIVEGYSRKGDRELAHFLNIAFASMSEVKYLLHFAGRLGYLSNNSLKEMEKRYDSLGKGLWTFYSKVKGNK